MKFVPCKRCRGIGADYGGPCSDCRGAGKVPMFEEPSFEGAVRVVVDPGMSHGWRVESPSLQAAIRWHAGRQNGKASRIEELRAAVERAGAVPRGFDVQGKRRKTFQAAGRVEGAVENDNRPKCKTHRVRMKYNANEDRMECSEQGCKEVAYRRRTFEGVFGAGEMQQPAVYRGDIELVFDEEGNPYLFLVGVRGMVDISNFVREGNGDLPADSKSRFLAAIEANAPLEPDYEEDAEIDPLSFPEGMSQEELNEIVQRDLLGRKELLGTHTSTPVMRVNEYPLPPHLSSAVDAARVKREMDSLRGIDRRSAFRFAVSFVDKSRDSKTAKKRLDGRRSDGKLIKYMWMPEDLSPEELVRREINIMQALFAYPMVDYVMDNGIMVTRDEFQADRA